MRSIVLATLVGIGSLIPPASFALWSAPAGPGQATEGAPFRRLLAAPSGASDDAPPDTPPTSTIDRPVESLTREEQDLVAWAFERFALVGLEPPAVDIAFHDDTAPCGGDHGRFRSSSGHRSIAVCVPDWGTFASRLERQRTLVHELAHAWDHAHLDDEDRADLLDVVDATEWYAPDAAWDERGIERFAETIVWGLYDQLRRPVLVDVPCAELHADFLAITGFAALGPVEPVCDLPSRHPAM